MQNGRVDDALLTARHFSERPNSPAYFHFLEAQCWAEKQNWERAWNAWQAFQAAQAQQRSRISARDRCSTFYFLFYPGVTYFRRLAIVATRSNDPRHIYLSSSVSPFNCYYSRSLVL